jgi:5-methylcytosine-specific restriction protein A
VSKPTIQFGTRRAVEEWIADHPDQEIPKRVKLRIFDRQNGRCAISGVKLMPGQIDYDHIKRLRDGGEHRESNIRAVWRKPHREKTAQENSEQADADRIRAKHLGLWKGSGRKLQSRNTFRDRKPV